MEKRTKIIAAVAAAAVATGAGVGVAAAGGVGDDDEAPITGEALDQAQQLRSDAGPEIHVPVRVVPSSHVRERELPLSSVREGLSLALSCLRASCPQGETTFQMTSIKSLPGPRTIAPSGRKSSAEVAKSQEWAAKRKNI